ncbi:MAG: response regulator transcription factor [Gammaproteobacteria bacterium]|nr:response regulator transcription factor [Gammaproteobacteria bacterium]
MSQSSRTSIRTLVVDDHPVVRYGVKHILDAEPDIEVVGDIAGIDDIGAVLDRLQPDVVLLDLELGDIQGTEGLRQLREVAPQLKVIIYTSHDEEECIIQAAELGVDGYLLKGSPKEEIVGAVRSVNDGGTAIESAVAAKLMNHMNKRSAMARRPAITFSKREKQVLELLAEGKTNCNIGATLFISESTVKFHVHAILGKLDAGNRTEAVSIAVQHGIISLQGEH